MLPRPLKLARHAMVGLVRSRRHAPWSISHRGVSVIQRFCTNTHSHAVAMDRPNPSSKPTSRHSSSSPNPSPSTRGPPIVVIGAGVIGLSTGNLLQTVLPDRIIILLAAEIPSTSTSPSPSYTPAYASLWAGAHYRPIFPSTSQLKIESNLAQRTFEVMKLIAEETPDAGVKLLQGVEYLDRPGEGQLHMKDGDVYAGVGDGFRVLNRDELIEGVSWGCEYTTYCVNVPVYCAYLLRRFEEKGGRVVRRRIKSATAAFDVDQDDVGGEVSTLVNCSGTNFGHDPKVSFIRGQTVLVKNKYHRTVTRQYADGRWATLIPRPLDGGTIVGVSKEMGDEEENARPETRQLLLEQSVECFPDFVEKVEQFEIMRDNVGMRPFREGGLRMEVEDVDNNRKRIVHGYGAGGRGYELSWGVAERLVGLVNSDESVGAKVMPT